MEPVTCRVRVENAHDPSRAVEIVAAVVDLTGPMLSVPASVLWRLGIDVPVAGRRCGPVRLWVEGRDMALDAEAGADDSPV